MFQVNWYSTSEERRLQTANVSEADFWQHVYVAQRFRDRATAEDFAQKMSIDKDNGEGATLLTEFRKRHGQWVPVEEQEFLPLN